VNQSRRGISCTSFHFHRDKGHFYLFFVAQWLSPIQKNSPSELRCVHFPSAYSLIVYPVKKHTLRVVQRTVPFVCVSFVLLSLPIHAHIITRRKNEAQLGNEDKPKMASKILEFPVAVKEVCRHCGAQRNPNYESTCFTCEEPCCDRCAWCSCGHLAEHLAELYAMHREPDTSNPMN
jgi:hypothetical protein